MIIAAMANLGLAKAGWARGLAVGAVTAGVWALAAGSAAYWLLHVGGAALAPVAPAADVAPSQWRADTQAVARSLGGGQTKAAPEGATPAEPAAPVVAELERLKLQGVLTHGAGGAALLALDGAPARTLRIGQGVDGLSAVWRLHAVEPHAVVLVHETVLHRLEMPPMDQRSIAGDAQASQRALPTATDSGGAALNPALAQAQARARAQAARQRAAASRP